ncbi:dynein regulatory complex subunit 3 isoform X1 [Salminus brasiliensis]|uniref:dynein regulatory complex subunit 3 isoform X1 n=1 Tax=Salminus brasiliensis TaxID=930266 RepID=UPI003B835FE0
MSMWYDTLGPCVIDEEMLQKAVEEQGPQGQAGRIAKEEGIQYDEVIQLRLDYRNILKIDHLWEFTSLTKLQLHNNIIEKIQGIEKLTNLVWLDLSFNNIEVIEGLDTLVKLQDLSLFNNRISTIENMDTLENLEILSLGKNAISQLDNVIYLRRFKNLRTLNLAGNPVCQEENYKIFVAAYLSDLVYLDFRLLDEQTRERALTQIEVMTNNEVQEKRAMEAQKITEQELQLHKVMAGMQKATDTKLLETQISNYGDEISQMCDTLMTLELQLVDQLEDIIKDFERNISDMVGGFTEYVQGIFAQCRDLENHHHEKLLEIAVATLERVAKNELEEDLPDDVRLLFVDKDTVVNAVSASHDTHLLKIDNREDELITRINSWMTALIKSVQDEEIERNRKRISEIHNYIDHVRDQLEDILLHEQQ